MPSICLGCGASFNSRKQLATHGTLCAKNVALSAMAYERKRKPGRSGSSARQGKRSRSSPARVSPARESPTAGPSVSFQDDTVGFEDVASNYEVCVCVVKKVVFFISR